MLRRVTLDRETNHSASDLDCFGGTALDGELVVDEDECSEFRDIILEHEVISLEANAGMEARDRDIANSDVRVMSSSL